MLSFCPYLLAQFGVKFCSQIWEQSQHSWESDDKCKICTTFLEQVQVLQKIWGSPKTFYQVDNNNIY